MRGGLIMAEKNVEFKELIYDLMNGMMELNEAPSELRGVIENEFEIGKVCEEAYQNIYDAYHHICEKFCVSEDKDVETILTNYSLITRFLSMKMYDYGSLFLHDENIKELIKFYRELSDVKKIRYMELIDILKKALSNLD